MLVPVKGVVKGSVEAELSTFPAELSNSVEDNGYIHRWSMLEAKRSNSYSYCKFVTGSQRW